MRHVLAFLTAAMLAGPALAGPAKISQAPKNAAPSDPADRTGMNDPFLAACLKALSSGELSRGVEFCTQALIIDPNDPDALELRGYGFLLQHRFDKAEVDLRAAVRIRPDNPQDVAGLGQSLAGQYRFAEAVPLFSKAVALAPDNAAFHHALCWARAGTGKELLTALADCEAALVLAPGTPAPLNGRGLVKLRLGRYAEAITDYTASLKVRSAQPSASFGRGLAHLALHHTGAGVADIAQARAGDSQIDSMFIAMGILPDDCSSPQKVKCPPGFPPRQQREMSAGGLIARWMHRP
jgi:Flp pilus assembly protein TadD